MKQGADFGTELKEELSEETAKVNREGAWEGIEMGTSDRTRK
jgi:hypothetical protein